MKLVPFIILNFAYFYPIFNQYKTIHKIGQRQRAEKIEADTVKPRCPIKQFEIFTKRTVPVNLFSFHFSPFC